MGAAQIVALAFCRQRFAVDSRQLKLTLRWTCDNLGYTPLNGYIFLICFE